MQFKVVLIKDLQSAMAQDIRRSLPLILWDLPERFMLLPMFVTKMLTTRTITVNEILGTRLEIQEIIHRITLAMPKLLLDMVANNHNTRIPGCRRNTTKVVPVVVCPCQKCEEIIINPSLAAIRLGNSNHSLMILACCLVILVVTHTTVANQNLIAEVEVDEICQRYTDTDVLFQSTVKPWTPHILLWYRQFSSISYPSWHNCVYCLPRDLASNFHLKIWS